MTTSGREPEEEEEEKKLLDAVLLAPRDDEPRLVYADWLMERGDRARGELIVVQCTRESCERAGQRASAAYRAACARERVLLAENVERWTLPVGLRNWWGDFSRGFIHRLTISPTDLRAKWSTSFGFARMPLQSIKLHGQRSRRRVATGEPIALRDLAWLAAQPEAMRLEVIEIETTEGVCELDWPAVRASILERGLGLEREVDPSAPPSPVWQPGCGLPITPLSDGVRVLTLPNATSSHISDLNLRAPQAMQSLHVTAYALDAQDITLLLATSQLRTLRALSLLRLDEASATAALASNPRAAARFPDLRELVLTGRDRREDLGSNVARALSSNRMLQTIESLHVDVALDEALIRALDTKGAKLRHLVVRGGAADYAIDALARSPLIKRLATLSLVGADNRSFGPPSIMPLMRADLTSLSSLSLENFLIGDGNAQAIKNASALSGLVELRLVRCGLTDERARTIASSPYLRALTKISLENNSLTPAAVEELRARWPEAVVQS